jgi:hypothetical protein
MVEFNALDEMNSEGHGVLRHVDTLEAIMRAVTAVRATTVL